MAPKRPFSELEWQLIPESVRRYIQQLESALFGLNQRVEKLEALSRKDSTNSSKPPSSDSPFKRPARKRKKSKRAKGGQKGHPGRQHQTLAPTRTVELKPERCPCGCTDFGDQQCHRFHTHQHIELPPIQLEVTHYGLNQCQCPRCGRIFKAQLPAEAQTGYGPHLSAFIAELSGIKAMSRADVQSLCASVLGLPIATGTIQKILDRASAALAPAYQKMADAARCAEVNYVDETCWFKEHDLKLIRNHFTGTQPDLAWI